MKKGTGIKALGIALVLVLVLLLYAQVLEPLLDAQDHYDWNTDGYFIDATVESVLRDLSAGADVNARDELDMTPLYKLGYATPEVIKVLLKAGADVNAKDKYYQSTPLHSAAGYAEPEKIALLLNAGADVNAKDEDGSTPLHEAADFNAHTPEIVEILLDAGGDQNAKDKWGHTVSDYIKNPYGALRQ